MRILGLDLGTKTGWCYVVSRGPEWIPERWGTLDLSPPKGGGEPEGVRFLKLYEGVRELLPGVDAVAMEQPFIKPGLRRVAEILNGMVAVALVAIEQEGLEYVFVPPAKWKKPLTGNGNAGKPLVRQSLNGWARIIEPGTTIREDEADALGVAKWLSDRMHPPGYEEVEF